MWKKTWLIGILMAATALSGCSCGAIPGTPDGGNTADGGQGGGNNGNTDGGDDGGTIDPGNGGVTVNSLSITPKDVSLVVRGSTPITQAFKVTGLYSDGHSEDVTSQVILSVDDTRVGIFEGTVFRSTTTVGGATTVRARLGTTSTSTPLTVKLEQRVPDTTSDPASGAPGATPLPSSPETKFDGPVSTDPKKPQIVYPNHGVIVPPNLGQLEIHFLPGVDSNTLFELAFTNAVTDVRVYLRCYKPSTVTVPTGETRACIYTPTKNVWSFVAETNRGGNPVQLTLRATSDAGGGAVSASNPIALQFARSELKGALYYWTTSTPTGVMRYDFAGPATDKASAILNRNNISTSVTCVGCHALSRNGKKLVAEVNGQNDGKLALVKDLSTFTPTSKVGLTGPTTSIFESWSPDGNQFVGVYADRYASRFGLMLFDGNTAAFQKEITGTGTSANPANHPDWSADGKTIAYTSVGSYETNQRSFKGAIHMVTSDGSGGWNAPVTVVPSQSGKHRYYPAIAPDSSFLLYNESTCPSGDVGTHCNGDTDPTAMLWGAKLQANATPVKLTRANAPGIQDKGETQLTNSYPKWSPFVTRGNGTDTSKLMWVTFSSSRMYGLRNPPPLETPSSETTKGTLLWMAAVDPDKLAAGVDPSYPAFALPFQDLGTSNHIAQWAEYFVSNGCKTVEEGCGAGSTCCNGLQCVQVSTDPPIPCDVAGACVCKPIPQCAAAFDKCSAAAPCCDGNTCVDTATGAACSGGDCTCRPPCSGAGQSCAGGSACCEGLKCNVAAGNVCQVVIN